MCGCIIAGILRGDIKELRYTGGGPEDPKVSEVCVCACSGMSRVYSCHVTNSERGVDGWRKRKLVMLYRVLLMKLPAAFILKFQLLHAVL